MEAYFDNSATTRCFEEVKDIVVKTMMEDFGIASPEKRIFLILSGTLYSNPFKVEIIHSADTAHTSVVTSLSIR